MSRVIRMAIADDIKLHRDLLINKLAAISNKGDVQYEVVSEFENGKLLSDAVAGLKVDLIASDIRMPEMDGLTGLLIIRRKLKLTTPVIMISSEQEDNIDRSIAKKQDAKELSWDDKINLMKKVEERVLNGVQEAGKLNDLLSGCARLQIDPVKYARLLGANGYVVKPYNEDKLQQILTALFP